MFSQIFNLINCRKIGAADTNVFERILHNWIYLVLFVATFAGQIVIVQVFGGLIDAVPLYRSEWGACITVGALTLIIAFFLKFTPGKWVEFLDVQAIGVDEDDTNTNALTSAIMQATGGKINEWGPATPAPDGETELVVVTDDAQPGDDNYTPPADKV